eukprot:5716421-Amphidinium_carterae.1
MPHFAHGDDGQSARMVKGVDLRSTAGERTRARSVMSASTPLSDDHLGLGMVSAGLQMVTNYAGGACAHLSTCDGGRELLSPTTTASESAKRSPGAKRRLLVKTASLPAWHCYWR